MRIIAGDARGRTLKTPPGRSTRPTSDRVREALFSILASAAGSLEHLQVIDLFAGSGALGLEALSRGCSRALFVDRCRACQQVIQDNAARLGFAERCHLMPMAVEPALEVLRRQGDLFDLALADPPYAEDPIAVLETLAGGLALRPGGLLSLEHGQGATTPETVGALSLLTRRKYGDTGLSIYQANT